MGEVRLQRRDQTFTVLVIHHPTIQLFIHSFIHPFIPPSIHPILVPYLNLTLAMEAPPLGCDWRLLLRGWAA